MSLNYKHIPFVTEYIDYHKIHDTVKSLGGAPSPFVTPRADGEPRFTVPTIRDTDTGAVVTDSTLIAEYLDKTFFDSLSGPLFPHGSRAAIALLEQTFLSTYMNVYPVAAPIFNKAFTVAGQEHNRNMIEARLQMKFEDLPPLGSPEGDALIQKALDGLNRLAKLYERNGKDSLWFLGDTFSFADVVIASFLTTFKLVIGEESEEWKKMASWNEGRWDKLVDATKILMTGTEKSSETSGLS